MGIRTVSKWALNVVKRVTSCKGIGKDEEEKKSARPELALLHLVRWVACMCVLLYHYDRFGWGTRVPEGSLPFEAYFPNMLHHGDTGVRVFWQLSGVVFAHNYGSRKDAKRTGAVEFVVRRLGRLYPLHLVTLLLMAAIQKISMRVLGHYQVFVFNTYYHFKLHLFMLDAFGDNYGRSFNAPTWSTSAELAAYALFLLNIKTAKSSEPFTSAVVLYLFMTRFNSQDSEAGRIDEVVARFYTGVLVYQVYCRFRKYSRVPAPVTLALCIAIVFYFWTFFAGTVSNAQCQGTAALLFVTLAAEDTLRAINAPLGWLAPIGNVTYAIYLTHVPLFCTLMLLGDLEVIDMHAGKSYLLLFAAVLALHVVGHFIYTKFELPANQKARTVYKDVAEVFSRNYEKLVQRLKGKYHDNDKAGDGQMLLEV